MSTSHSPNDAGREEHMAVYRECQRLLDERTALPWWNFWRWAGINQEIQELLDSLEDDS